MEDPGSIRRMFHQRLPTPPTRQMQIPASQKTTRTKRMRSIRTLARIQHKKEKKTTQTQPKTSEIKHKEHKPITENNILFP